MQGMEVLGRASKTDALKNLCKNEFLESSTSFVCSADDGFRPSKAPSLSESLTMLEDAGGRLKIQMSISAAPVALQHWLTKSLSAARQLCLGGYPYSKDACRFSSCKSARLHWYPTR